VNNSITPCVKKDDDHDDAKVCAQFVIFATKLFLDVEWKFVKVNQKN
jgi:hypothetical protein